MIMSKHGEVMRCIERNYFRATQQKEIKVSEYIDSKARKAIEFGRIKPYACCYGNKDFIGKQKRGL